jgi:probable rRNA maturation factor
MKYNITVFAEQIVLPFKGINKVYVKKSAQNVLSLLGLDDFSCLIILTDNSYIKEINRKFRKKNKPTDVISFPGESLDLPGVSPVSEPGEIYISLETALSQSEKFGVTLKKEVDRLIVHGILHLAGYDHERSSDDEAEMTRIENSILNKL